MKSMKKFLIMTTLILGVMNTGLAQNSHALIGLAFKSKPVKVVGAVGAVGGSMIAVWGYTTALTATNLGVLLAGAIWTGYGVIIGGVGLVILDDKNISDIEFKALDANRPESYVGFTREQVETYNSELAQLNSIRQTMIAESSDEADTADAEVLWKKYSAYLSNDTVQIAQKNAAQFLSAIR
jgi:hypothetical protein